MTFNLQEYFLMPTECTYLSKKEITSAVPADGQTLVYREDTGHFDYATPLTLDGNQTVTGALTVQDWVAFGANGTHLNNMQVIQATAAGPIAAGASVTTTVAITGFVTVPPIVIAQGQLIGTTRDFIVSVRRPTADPPTSVDVVVYNASGTAEPSNVTINLLVLEAAPP